MHEVGQLLRGLHHFHRTQIDTAQHDTGLFRRFDVCLQRRLTIEFNGEVNHVASLHQTIGRRIRPSASDIDAYGRTPPYNLVVSHTEGWFLLLIGSIRTEPLTQ